MTRGTFVRALYMPHLGIGVVLRVEDNTRLLVSFPDAEWVDQFSPHELETVEKVAA